MKRKLDIQWFIEQNADWERKIQEKPYCVQVSRDHVFGRNLVMLKYNQIESDFNIGLVRECRGIILDEDTLEPVCIPFFKFGNYGESYCPEIDWSSCWVGEKLDGSLIKIVRLGDKLLISTNGTIDAFKAPLAEQIGCSARSFGDLVVNALFKEYQLNMDKAGKSTVNDDVVAPVEWLTGLLDEGKTYMFELTSPFNKVVVTWHETRLNFLGVRDNETFQETYFCDHELKNCFNVPKVFPLKSIDDCVKAAEQLDCNNEGFVVCDKNFNRVKVKSTLYVSLHHMKNNGILSYERGIEIVRGNELGEVLTYFPEFKQHLEDISAKYAAFVDSMKDAEKLLSEWIVSNGYDREPWWIENGGKKRKDLAAFVMKNFKFPGVGFSLVDKKVASVDEWAKAVPAKNLVKILGYKE